MVVKPVGSLLLIALWLISCGGEHLLDPLPENAVILAYGDSLTDGKGVGRQDAYPAALEALLGHQVVNAGVSGETTAQGLARLPAVLDDTQPDLMVLLEGGNDILRNLDLDQAQSNIEAMISLAKARDIDVVLVGVPQKKLLSKTAKFYRTLAQSHSVPLQDDIIASLLRKPAMKSDSVHFNRAGYRQLALAIKQVLDQNGAL